MSPRQLDLFAAAGYRPPETLNPATERPRLAACDLDEDALIAAIPWASLSESCVLAAEAGRRRLIRAVPALEALCRRFKGFGIEEKVPEQAASVEALAAIGGPDAANAVARILVERIVQGPGLDTAVRAAARLGIGLPDDTVLPLLRDAAPQICADACRCARPSPPVIGQLLQMLGDTDRRVYGEAACALGRIGRAEARPTLLRLLREVPTPEIIDAAIAIADEECLVLLDRIARTRADLAEAALAALDSIATPRAAVIAAASRRPSSA